MSKIKIYKASAGSGKTYTLALEYIKELLIAPFNENYRHILAVTFTKEATGEMKDRILAELYGLAFCTEDSAVFRASMLKILKEAGHDLDEKQIREKSETLLKNILHDYSRLNITTIDSFFQRVLRNLARELGKGSKFNLEMNVNKVLQEAVHATIEKANQNRQILEWLTTYIEHKLDDDRNWRIENEIFEFSKCIYNEFFQEHERTLRKQLEENPQLFKKLKKQQEQIKKECKEYFITTYQKLQQLLNDHNLDADDFIRKGIPVHFFRKLADGNYKVDINKTILDCCIEPSSWTNKTHKRRNEIIDLAALSLIPLLNDTLNVLKVRLTSGMITGNLHQLGLVWDITNEITERNTENNRFMLSDTAMFLNEMIDDSDAPFIYEKLGADIHHVMIDEFQDTSRMQWNNFKALLSDILASNRFSLIVGDVKQSIYRWRNGDWRILNSIGKELNVTPQSLEYNYRSEKNVIDFNNSFFTFAASLLNQLYENKFGDISQSPFCSTYNEKEVCQKTQKKIVSGYVSVDFIPDKKEDVSYPELMQEAVFLQLKILYEQKIPAKDICILTRNNKEIIILADYLSSLKADYPEMAKEHYLNIVSNDAFQLKSSPAVMIIIEALKITADSGNTINREQLRYLLSCFNLVPEHSLKEKYTPLSIGEGPETTLPLFELIGYLYRLFKLEQIEGQSAYLFAFYDFVSKYLNENQGDIHHFLQYWEEELKIKTISTGSNVFGVRAMTIHKSKGLQFHTVVIPYCDWSLNPKTNTTVWCGPKEGLYNVELLPVAYTSSMSETVFQTEYQEETFQSWMDNLNILYVGFTRAEHNLVILAKYKKSLKGIDTITAVSDLLQLTVSDLNGKWNEETLHFEFGTRSPAEEAQLIVQEDVSRPLYAQSQVSGDTNPLKETPPSMNISFVSEEFQQGKSIFKQSNQSREFVNPDASDKEKYIAYGNIMHKLFEQITHFEDIEKAIDDLIMQGLIQPDEKQKYRNKIETAIRESQTENWFNNSYKTYKEYSILTEENGEVLSRRPDRVLLSEKAAIVVDYKFGKARDTHKEQVKQYMDLLEKMNYPNVEGYLWYVEERKVCPV
ncbi:MAG: UvrD-helicase domain-containing protein [Dysgonamonadaceae bacterium]|jgi:ATP-dependent exoDNAse (exonuclease V) beta subunit|nr:UvrD-helicase domain-containing protein [Dysgonamonadaceae bacterium]